MRKVLIIINLLFVYNVIFTQNNKNADKEKQVKTLSKSHIIDSLKLELQSSRNDTSRVSILNSICFEYLNINPEEGIKFGYEGLNLAQKINWENGIAKCYYSIASNYSNKSEFSKALDYYEKALLLNRKMGNKSLISNNLIGIGVVYRRQSNFQKALDYYNQALIINKELNNRTGLADILSNIAIVYAIQSKYTQSLDYFFQALKINEELSAKSGISANLSNIGRIYQNLSMDINALEYYLKAIKINEELNNFNWMATNLSAIGNIYSSQNDNIRALEFLNKALSINQTLGNKSGIATTLSSIGKILLKNRDFKQSQEYFNRALELNSELNIKSSIADNLGSIGELLLKQVKDSSIIVNRDSKEFIEYKGKNIKLAIENILKAVDIYKASGELHNQSSLLVLLSDAYETDGNFQLAYQTYKNYKYLQDSIFSIDKEKEIANLESKRELEIKEKENQLLIKDNQLFNAELLQKNQKISLDEKEKQVQHLAFLNEQAKRQEKEKQLSLKETQMKLQKSQIETLDKDKEKQDAELRAKNLQRNFFVAGLFSVLILFIIAFIRFREKKKLSEKLSYQNMEIEKQKNMVETQKHFLEDKNHQIISSISYAATIQNALLPWSSVLNKSFKEHFVIYMPKDIVSGDSYWFQEVDGVKYLAVIDCTGHGVPGSMLTVIANSVLDDAVLSKKLISTSEILTFMNEKVAKVLNQRLSENSIRDGMEVCLIAIHKDKIQFSGAGRPLYVKNGTFETLKTDKQGIAGQNDNDTYNYTSVEIETQDNMMIYLSSDGYADQMNESSKKYSTKRFLEILERISELPLEKQKEILENDFNCHKGNREQIDDVTIIGVRI